MKAYKYNIQECSNPRKQYWETMFFSDKFCCFFTQKLGHVYSFFSRTEIVS